jgi:hypothetical protein
MFEGTPVASHLVIDDQIFVNARDKTDPGMEQIKKTRIHVTFIRMTVYCSSELVTNTLPVTYSSDLILMFTLT